MNRANGSKRKTETRTTGQTLTRDRPEIRPRACAVCPLRVLEVRGSSAARQRSVDAPAFGGRRTCGGCAARTKLRGLVMQLRPLFGTKTREADSGNWDRMTEMIHSASCVPEGQ